MSEAPATPVYELFYWPFNNSGIFRRYPELDPPGEG